MMPERILVCGGRDYEDQAMLFGVLDMLAEERVINAVIQGDCPTGADKLARMWAISRNHHLDRFPADWNTHGRAAGCATPSKRETATGRFSGALGLLRSPPSAPLQHPEVTHDT